MIRIQEIQDALMHVCGWEQDIDPSAAIAESLTKSESGLTFQAAHPLVTLDTMAAVMPDKWGMQYAAWDELRQYSVGDKVSHGGDIWKAVTDNVGVTPSKEAAQWERYSKLSDYLEALTRNGIATVMQTFIQMKSLEKETRNLLERRTFFDGAGRIADFITPSGKICGYEIVPVRSMGVTAKIERIGLQMRGATGTVRVYLFHSSQAEPIKTFDLEYTKENGSYQWFEVEDTFLPYISDDTNAGGAWYLCYNQNDLPQGMRAINISKDWSREPCGTCNRGNLQAWRELTQYLMISPFAHTAEDGFAESPQMWDVASNLWTNTMCYGINVEISVGCDLTDFIISQRGLFATVIQRQVALTALRTLALNPNARVNRLQSNASREDILYELDGNTSGTRPAGLGYDLKKAYEALRIDTQGIDRVCLSCNNRGVKYRTA